MVSIVEKKKVPRIVPFPVQQQRRIGIWKRKTVFVVPLVVHLISSQISWLVANNVIDLEKDCNHVTTCTFHSAFYLLVDQLIATSLRIWPWKYCNHVTTCNFHSAFYGRSLIVPLVVLFFSFESNKKSCNHSNSQSDCSITSTVLFDATSFKWPWKYISINMMTHHYGMLLQTKKNMARNSNSFCKVSLFFMKSFLILFFFSLRFFLRLFKMF